MSLFSSRQKIKIRMSVHNLSHSFSGSFYPGLIYPILATKVVPGDTFQVASNPDLRTQPLVTPFFTNTRVDIRYFYVRNLLLWKNFDEYITGHDRYDQSTGASHVHPYVNFDGERGSIQDYMMGCIDSDTKYRYLDALPYRAYNMIYNEYYKDENVGSKATVNLTDGADSNDLYRLLKASYRKDYFTASFPFTQAGDPVVLPSRLILGDPSSQSWVDANKDPLTDSSSNQNAFFRATTDDGVKLGFTDSSVTPSVYRYGYLDPGDSLGVNIDIREFRQANAIQRFLERSAVGGNRYAEYMLTHFGVHTPDNSSFRPQYLGGGESFLNVNAVEQNSETSDDSPLGTLAGKGRLCGVCGMNHRYFFSEYGWIIGLMVIRPDAQYCGGVNKQYFADGDRFDNYYNPAFQNIGMDEIKIRELAYPVGSTPAYSPTNVFSYQERGFQYKTIPNTVHGEMAGGSLKSWSCVRDFSGLDTEPQFNDKFVEVDSSCLDDQSAVTEYPLFFGSIGHHIIARRPMQYRAKFKIG